MIYLDENRAKDQVTSAAFVIDAALAVFLCTGVVDVDAVCQRCVGIRHCYNIHVSSQKNRKRGPDPERLKIDDPEAALRRLLTTPPPDQPPEEQPENDKEDEEPLGD